MPIYEYACTRCQQRFERLQHLSDPLITVCPSCGGAVHKQFSIPALHFKGSGFYKTDYAPRRPSGSVSTEGKPPSEAAKSDSKPAPGGSSSE